ncbi:hypothetical protein CL618_00745 [archaeon]|nr:hypothetical protein [archaeon]|tara:strand:- start:2823 stop:3704 length:882 start_codon:yes stop_codon:yes gene_type:complete
MEFNKNLAAVHGYLCGDGYVIRNPETQKHKYYVVGFRNQNLTLLNDFNVKFNKQFKKLPKLRDARCVVNSKEIYYQLVQKFNSFYSKDWSLPNMDCENLKYWLRAFFDCEAWVIAKERKSRLIALDSINCDGIRQIGCALEILGIKNKIRENKKRNIYRLFIFGKENLIRYQKKIGFLHKNKKEKLKKDILSYMSYTWEFPKNKIKKVVNKIMKEKAKVNMPYTVRIVSNKENNLVNLSKNLFSLYKIDSKTYKRKNGFGTVYFTLNIHKKSEVAKMIRLGLLNKKEENKIIL